MRCFIHERVSLITFRSGDKFGRPTPLFDTKYNHFIVLLFHLEPFISERSFVTISGMRH